MNSIFKLLLFYFGNFSPCFTQKSPNFLFTKKVIRILMESDWIFLLLRFDRLNSQMSLILFFNRKWSLFLLLPILLALILFYRLLNNIQATLTLYPIFFDLMFLQLKVQIKWFINTGSWCDIFYLLYGFLLLLKGNRFNILVTSEVKVLVNNKITTKLSKLLVSLWKRSPNLNRVLSFLFLK